jgi:predicted RNase H-like HicB family nuclease
MEYAIIIEKTATGYSAYVPDLPGCAAAGETRVEVTRLIREGIRIYLEDMRLDGEPVPVPTTHVEYVTVAEAVAAA